MGCLHSKTANIHSPEDPPTALPDSKKPDPGSFLTFLCIFHSVLVFNLWESVSWFFCWCGVCQNLAFMGFEAKWGWLFFSCFDVGLRKFGFLVCFDFWFWREWWGWCWSRVWGSSIQRVRSEWTSKGHKWVQHTMHCFWEWWESSQCGLQREAWEQSFSCCQTLLQTLLAWCSTVHGERKESNAFISPQFEAEWQV